MKLSITELNKNLSNYLNQSRQEDIVITNHGKDVAVITSPEKYAAFQQGQTTRFKTLADALATIDGVDFDWELPTRETWDEKDLF